MAGNGRSSYETYLCTGDNGLSSAATAAVLPVGLLLTGRLTIDSAQCTQNDTQLHMTAGDMVQWLTCCLQPTSLSYAGTSF